MKTYIQPAIEMKEATLLSMIMTTLPKSDDTIPGPDALSRNFDLWQFDEEEE